MSLALCPRRPRYFSLLLRQYERKCKQSDERGSLHEKGSAGYRGGGIQVYQMVGKTQKLDFILNAQFRFAGFVSSFLINFNRIKSCKRVSQNLYVCTFLHTVVCIFTSICGHFFCALHSAKFI